MASESPRAPGRRQKEQKRADARPQADSTGWAVVLLVVLVSIIWIALGQSQSAFFVGPSEWDDNLYCDLAAIPRPVHHIAFRSLHTWILRIFNLLMDTRRAAGGLYPTLLTVGLSWIGFFLARRIAGVWCGLLAAVLMPFHPALLKYLSVPYSDTAMAFWGGLAVLCALAATDAASPRKRLLAVGACGVFTLFSMECKETGIATLPPVLLALWACEKRLKVALLWFAGLLAGFLLLSTLDGLFIGDFWWHWKWSTYFPQRSGGGGGSGTYRMGQHYLGVLRTGPFLSFTLLGVAGAAVGYRRNLPVRCLALWGFGGLLFSSLISLRYHGVQALDRYCVVMAVPLVVLSASWFIGVWRRGAKAADDRPRRVPVGMAVVVLITLGLASYGLIQELAGRADRTEVRFAFFLMPPALLLLFLSPWLVGGRWFPRVAVALMLVAAAALSTRATLEYRDFKRQQLQPWVLLTRQLDKAGANLVKWNLPPKPYATFRIARRCRTLSNRPAEDIQVREIESLAEVGPNEWIFSSPEMGPTLVKKGWIPFVQGRQEGAEFVAYRPVR